MTQDEKWAEAERLIEQAKASRDEFIEEMKLLQADCRELKETHLSGYCMEENKRHMQKGGTKR